MQVENPINNLPTYESKPKDSPLSSVAPTNNEKTNDTSESVGVLCIICIYIEFCCCAIFGS